MRSLPFLPAATAEKRDARAAIGHHHGRASKQRDEVAPPHSCVPIWPILIVYPLGSARMTRAVRVVPPAPAMFSITIGWLSVRDMCSLTMRSVPPPAGKGTIVVMRRDG
jgi:hypothetical protein